MRHSCSGGAEQGALSSNCRVSFSRRKGGASDIFEEVADIVISMRKEVAATDPQNPPSTAEYLDAVRACIDLEVRPGNSPIWKTIESAVLVKRAVRTFDEG